MFAERAVNAISGQMLAVYPPQGRLISYSCDKRKPQYTNKWTRQTQQMFIAPPLCLWQRVKHWSCLSCLFVHAKPLHGVVECGLARSTFNWVRQSNTHDSDICSIAGFKVITAVWTVEVTERDHNGDAAAAVLMCSCINMRYSLHAASPH